MYGFKYFFLSNIDKYMVSSNYFYLIIAILLWTSTHGRAKAGGPARTYIQQLCAHTGCSLEDLPGAMDNRDGW